LVTETDDDFWRFPKTTKVGLISLLLQSLKLLKDTFRISLNIIQMSPISKHVVVTRAVRDDEIDDGSVFTV